MAGYINIFITTYLFCMVHSQFVLPGPGVTSRDFNGFEICGPLTSSITIIDNSMPLSLAHTLQSMILNNFLESSINLTPKSYQNSEFLSPCSFVIESVTYSPIIDNFYPNDDIPIYDIYPYAYTEISPSSYLTETVPPQVFYTETVTSFGPSAYSQMASSDIIGLSDLFTPNLQVVPVSCVNTVDVIPINSIPPNSMGLLDLILPPPMFGGYNDLYVSGVPCYFDNL